MKKIKFIYFNALIIILVSAFFSFAAETKNISKTVSPVKAVSDQANAPAQGSVKPLPADVSTPLKSSPVSAVANVTPESKASPAAVSSTPVKPSPASATANVTPESTATPVAAAPAAVSAPSLPGQASSYSYHPAGKPDPFKSFIVIVDKKAPKTKAAAEKKERPTSIFPLQKAETDQYKVVGIVGNENRRIAIVEDASKKHYPLSIGTRIGLNNGKVTEILADRVIVEEYDDDNKEKRVILKLRKN